MIYENPLVKMIVTDLDGTLLRSDKTVSEYTASVFRRCTDKGIKLVFATARPIRAVKTLNIPVNFDAGIYHNGAVIDTGQGNILRCGILPSEIKYIAAGAFKHDPQARLCAEIDDKIYGNCDVSDIWQGIEIILTDFSDLPPMAADKLILLTADMDKLEAVRNALPGNIYLEISENTVGMMMNKEATKINAVKQLCKVHKLSLNDIIAFGDDYNDIEMVRNCGIGVAVANAIDETKAAADYICGTNDGDGAAKWIEENVL